MHCFYTPIFRRDMIWWCPSGSPSVRPSQFCPLFSYMLWHIELKFCMLLSSYEHTIKFECLSISVNFCWFGTWKTGNCSFLHFPLTCFDILSWNFAYDFVLLYYRSSLSVISFLLIFVGVMPLLELRILKIRTFLLHALTYWAEIIHMTLFYCTKDQVWVSSIFLGVMPLLELRILEMHSIPHFSLTCFDILSWNFAHDFVLLNYKSSSSVVNLR